MNPTKESKVWSTYGRNLAESGQRGEKTLCGIELVALVGVEGSLPDLIFNTFPFDTVYTEQESGADFPIELGTSAFLNAL